MKILAITLLLAVSAVSQIKADCCIATALIRHVCMGIENEREMPFHKYLGIIDENLYWIRNDSDLNKMKCESLFCGDGYNMNSGDFYCGNGACNIFGCNCDDGCRSGFTEEEITKAFVGKYGFTKQAEHKIF